MNIFALACSPRKNGNTALLLDAFAAGVAASGYAVDRVWIPGLDIRPCRHCDYCLRAGVCAIKDDMSPLYERLLAADAIVMAAPIYFMAHCAHAKVFIDRCQVFWARKYRRGEDLTKTGRRRVGVFLSVGATKGEKVFAGAKVTMRWWLDALEAAPWGEVLIQRVDEKGAIASHPNALAAAERLGAELVSHLRSQIVT